MCGEPSPAPAPAQAQSTGEASSTSSVLDDVAAAIERWDRLPGFDETMEENLQQDVSDALGSVTCSSKKDPVTKIPTSTELKIIGVPSDYTHYTPTVDKGNYIRTRFWVMGEWEPPINVSLYLYLVPKAGTYESDGTLARFVISQDTKETKYSKIFTVGEQSVMSFSFEFIPGVTVVAYVEDWLCVK